jgi:hypothetical protein
MKTYDNNLEDWENGDNGKEARSKSNNKNIENLPIANMGEILLWRQMKGFHLLIT